LQLFVWRLYLVAVLVTFKLDSTLNAEKSKKVSFDVFISQQRWATFYCKIQNLLKIVTVIAKFVSQSQFSKSFEFYNENRSTLLTYGKVKTNFLWFFSIKCTI